MRTLRLVGLLILLGVIVWVGVGFTDLPEEAKRDIRSLVVRFVFGALAVGLALMAAPTLPAAALWWATAAAGAAAIFGPTVANAAEDVAEGVGGIGGDGSGSSVRCGDPGTCGQIINGALCLHSDCVL